MKLQIFAVALFAAVLSFSSKVEGTNEWENVSVESQQVMEASYFAVKRISNGVNSMYAAKLAKVLTAEKLQKASDGLRMQLKLVAGFTGCRKAENLDLLKCEFNAELNQALLCDVVVILKTSGEKELNKWHCTDKKLNEMLGNDDRVKTLLGGWQHVDVNDKTVQKLAKEAVNMLTERTSTIYRKKLVRVINASYQVVAGLNYDLVIEFGTTNCSRFGKKPDVECRLFNETHVQRCRLFISYVPWQKKITMNPSKITKCQTVKLDLQMEEKKQKISSCKKSFKEFQRKYEKQYGSMEEETSRFEIFCQNQEVIEKLKKTELGSGEYGNTIFADLTNEEFMTQHLGFEPSLENTKENRTKAEIPSAKIPESFDWRKHNAVTPVKNQGYCGSCWAFSTTGNIEGQWSINKKKLVSVSEQELVDCDKVDQGCNGGLPSNAYKQIIKLGGLETETDYPYEGVNDKCEFNKKEAKVYINGSVVVSSNETEMAQWLVKNGPISIGINAFAMQFYFGGVSHPWKFLCNPTKLDHGVLIVGYGIETTSILHRKLPYWIVKNSWGSSWGEEGYYRVYRGDGTCGLNRMPTSAVVH